MEFRDAHFKEDCTDYHDMIRDFPKGKPEIVTLCGSARFAEAFYFHNMRLTLEGKIVISIGCNLNNVADLNYMKNLNLDTDIAKAALDELHKRKIDLADRIFIVDVDGYIGSSTASEIAYAKAHEKPIDYLSKLTDVPWKKIPGQRPPSILESTSDAGGDFQGN